MTTIARCFAEGFVGRRNHRAFQHGRVRQDGVLDLDRGDVLAPRMMMSLERSLMRT